MQRRRTRSVSPVGNRVIMSALPFRLFSPHLAESPKIAHKKHPHLTFKINSLSCGGIVGKSG
jgi:hypothetical protein